MEGDVGASPTGGTNLGINVKCQILKINHRCGR